MTQISKHFKRSEFACQCGCGFDTVDVELIGILEEVRQYFMKPVTITSGCRCANHNYRIGGAKNSQHVFGRAADIQVKDTPPERIYEFINDMFPNQYGLGVYSGWVHIDSRNEKARWDER